MNKTIWALAFVVLACGVSFAITNATVNEIDQNKFTGTGTAGNFTTEGGNVTEMDIGTNASTEKWAGMYGNVSGQLVLSEAANTAYMYSWTYDPSAGGEVCASRNSNPVWASLAVTTRAALDTAWGFITTDADSATGTMTDASGVIDINGVSITSTAVTTQGSWQTVAGQGLGGTGKSPYAFCVNISEDTAAFNGKTVDFQLMVPTNETAGATEQYFFFIELV